MVTDQNYVISFKKKNKYTVDRRWEVEEEKGANITINI